MEVSGPCEHLLSLAQLSDGDDTMTDSMASRKLSILPVLFCLDGVGAIRDVGKDVGAASSEGRVTTNEIASGARIFDDASKDVVGCENKAGTSRQAASNR